MKMQDKLIKHWERKGYHVINLISLSKSGYPDLQALKNGITIFIESKEKWDELSELQKIRARQLIREGFDYYLNFELYKPQVEKTNLF